MFSATTSGTSRWKDHSAKVGFPLRSAQAKETVTVALEELIARRQQRRILRSLGTFDFREDWDYKRDRRANRG